MGKAPASQFYWGDWRRDTELHLMSFEARGIWIEMLSCMWDARERGKLEGSPEQISGLLGCPIGKLMPAIKEIGVTKTGDVTESNGFVTIINRRMFREEKERISTRLRVQKFRNKSVTQLCNRNITDVSSSSSSSSNKENIIKEIIFLGEFQNVLLSLEENKKLNIRFGELGTRERIEKLSQYMASKGKKYKSHYATILSWERKLDGTGKRSTW